MIHPWSSQLDFCVFSAQFLHEVMMIHYFTRHFIYYDDFSVIVSKDYHLLVKIFMFVGVNALLHSFDCNLNSNSKSLIHVSSAATVQYKNAWLLMTNLCFINNAMSKHICFCWVVSQWGTHWVLICLFHKSFVKIQNTDVDIPVAREISLQVAQQCL